MSLYRTGESCPACESSVTTPDGSCAACGHVWGSEHACPHCGVICRTLPDPARGCPCSKCGVPRIRAGWRMPPDTAFRLREAVRRERLSVIGVLAAVMTAAVCFAVGVPAAIFGGFVPWFLVLTVWVASLVYATHLRKAARKAVENEIARASSASSEEPARTPTRVSTAGASRAFAASDADAEAYRDDETVDVADRLRRTALRR